MIEIGDSYLLERELFHELKGFCEDIEGFLESFCTEGKSEGPDLIHDASILKNCFASHKYAINLWHDNPNSCIGDQLGRNVALLKIFFDCLAADPRDSLSHNDIKPDTSLHSLDHHMSHYRRITVHQYRL